MVEKLPGQTGMGPLVFGHHQQSGSVLVDTVHQSGPHVPLLKQGQILQMPGQGIDECPAIIAVPRMHHEPGRLVQYDEVVVFIQDVERNILRNNFHLPLGIGHHEGNTVERLHLVARLHGNAVHKDISAVGCGLHPAPRTVLQSHRQIFVDTEHGLPPVYRDGEMLVQFILLLLQLLRYLPGIFHFGTLHLAQIL